MKRADKFLESFKLGKLGAGAKIARPPEDLIRQKHVEVIHEVVSDRKPSIEWNDVDGFSYYLKIDRDMLAPDWYLELSCTTIGSAKVEWIGRFDAKKKPVGLRRYDIYVSIIKDEGIGGLLSKHKFNSFRALPGYWENFRTWLKTRQVD
jgi:hypothetical protein